MLTQERLKEVLRYNRRTGLFHWRATGKRAGTIVNNGYVRIGIDGGQYAAHRLAFLYVTGEWPKGEVDHRYGIKTDNRWKELRDTTTSKNQHNRRLPNAGHTLPLGVTAHRCGKFQAYIQVNKKARYLGLHATPQLAEAAYLKAKRAI